MVLTRSRSVASALRRKRIRVYILMWCTWGIGLTSELESLWGIETIRTLWDVLVKGVTGILCLHCRWWKSEHLDCSERMRNPACTTQRITAVIKQIVYASPFNAINLFLIEAAMGGFLSLHLSAWQLFGYFIKFSRELKPIFKNHILG